MIHTREKTIEQVIHLWRGLRNAESYLEHHPADFHVIAMTGVAINELDRLLDQLSGIGE